MTPTLTREATLALPAGRELDALVAEKIMGWKITSLIDNECDWAVGENRDGSDATRNFGVSPDGKRGHLPNYSTDWSAMALVLDHLRAVRWLYTLKHMPDGAAFRVDGSRSEYDAPCPDSDLAGSAGKALCELYCMDRTLPWPRRSVFAFAATVPHAVSLAALLTAASA